MDTETKTVKEVIKERNYVVAEKNSQRYYEYGITMHSNYADAEKDARASAWAKGKDHLIFGVIAVVRAPEEVNTVKVEVV